MPSCLRACFGALGKAGSNPNPKAGASVGCADIKAAQIMLGVLAEMYKPLLPELKG